MKKQRWLKEAYSYYNYKLNLILNKKREIEIILEQLKQDMGNDKQ